MADIRLVTDPNVRQREASDPQASVWLAASAGSGKTKVLTDRVLTLLLGGTQPSHILCLTFTKAAAAEMANRVTERLAEWTTARPAKLDEMLASLLGRVPSQEEIEKARRLFAEVLDAPGGLKIQTIHGFCESLIGRFPFESGVPPHFEVMDERSAREEMLRARDRVLAYAEADDALTDALAILTRHVQEDQFADLVATLTAERGRLLSGIVEAGGVTAAVAEVFRALAVEETETELTVVAAAIRNTEIDAENLRLAAEALLHGTEKSDQPQGRRLAAFLAADEADRAGLFDDYQDVFFTKSGDRRARLITKGAAKSFPRAEEILEHEAMRLEAVRDRLRSVTTAHATASLVRLGAAMVAEYEAMKARTVRLDYDDLILKARGLVRRTGVAPWVLFKLDGGIDHILIDEAQDTNPEQWDIVDALAEEFFSGDGARPVERTVFAVGDVKQSIFSFQRAAPDLFYHYKDLFAERLGFVERPWRDLDLAVSFRSTDAVLQAVDAVFAHESAHAGVEEPDTVIAHTPFRQDMAGLVELWPAVGPEAADPLDNWTVPVARVAEDNPSRRLAEMIAAQIKSWIGNEILPARDRPMRAGDVMILLRRRSGFMEQIVSALKNAGVPVAGVDRMMLSEQLAVMDLMALGRFLLLPEDDLTLATLLKTPLIGFDDDDLMRLAIGHGDAGLWQRLGDMAAEEPRFAAARDWLAALLARTGFERPFELFAGALVAPVISGVSGREAMLKRLGAEADDPITEFLNLAMAYEAAHTPSLEGFLHWMETGAVEVKRDLEQASADEVRVMTVHGAKGLQAPVVILPDTMSMPTASPGLLWQDKLPFWAPRRSLEPQLCRSLRGDANAARDDEYRRLLYVAMTRAEDRLHVCGHHGSKSPPEGCWYNLIRTGLEDIAEPLEFDFSTVAPNGWAGPGLRYETAQRAAAKEDTVREDRQPADDALPDWMARSAPVETVPTKPLTPSRPVDDPPAASPLGADGGARFKRGLIIHRLLQTLPDMEPGARRHAAARLLARPAYQLPPEEREEIAETVARVLDAPDFADLFGPGSKAEVPLAGTVTMRHGIEVVTGQVDRLVVRADDVLVVDYKSLRPPPDTSAGVPEPYLRQMAAYRAVLRGIWPEKKVRCALLWTENPDLMPLDDAQLDSYSAAP